MSFVRRSGRMSDAQERAWSELATSFGKAAEKIQSERDKAAAGEEHKTS